MASGERAYDVVVLGAGPVGENVASRARSGGLSVVVVEHELVGGECSFWACIPSKALLRPAQALATAQAVHASRQAVTGVLDVGSVLARRDSFTHDWDDSSQVRWLDSEDIVLVRGHGRLAGERRVEVATEDGPVGLHATHAVVVCTGSVAAVPDLPGLREAAPWTSREATSAKAAPRRLVVLGGGVVGCEMAQAWAGLGAEQVTMLVRGERVLPAAEPFASELVLDGLRAAGIEVRLGTSMSAVARDGAPEGPLTVTLDDGSTLETDEILVATGRRPTTADVGLETVGLEPGTELEVDDSGRVLAVEGGWLYAAGDVTGRARLTHQGKYAGRVVGDVVAARASGEAGAESPRPWTRWAATADHAAVPQVVFTDPEVASVGLTEARARERGLDVRVVAYEIGQVAGGSLRSDGYRGRACLVVDEQRKVVVGATFVGPDVAEMVHAATIAVVGEVPLDRLWHAVPSFPTMSEVWLRLLEAYGL